MTGHYTPEFTVSHETVTCVTKSLGMKHDQRVREWKMASTTGPSHGSSGNEPISEEADSEDRTQSRVSYPHYILVGDNIDKNVSPCDMRVDHQTKSYHYFYSLCCVRQN